MVRKPYSPALDCTAETTATTGPGRSAYVSGIQVWNGKTGVLIRNANAKPAKIQMPQAVPTAEAGIAVPITSVLPSDDAQRGGGEQQREAADQVVDQVLPGRARVRAVRDQHQEDRDQHQVPEQREQQQVLGQEDAVHRALQDQQLRRDVARARPAQRRARR